MHILITGGAGFLGQRLAQQLLKNVSLQRLTLADVAAPAISLEDDRIAFLKTDLTDAQAVKSLVTAELTAVYHLAAVVSGQAEANFDLGMAVNGDGTRHLLEAVRHQAPGAKFIFASSLAVFGGDLPQVITDETAVAPRSSYGTQKAIAELWVNDYSRKGFIDGCVLRLPTVCVRPGKPNAAASSFASSIIREPLQGQSAICPVDPSLALWISSPEAVVQNLVHSLTLNTERFEGSRTINLPGLTVTVEAMIDALASLTDQATAGRIQYQPGRAISQIVASWPSEFDVSRAIALGFTQDHSFEEIIRAFISSNGSKDSNLY